VKKKNGKRRRNPKRIMTIGKVKKELPKKRKDESPLRTIGKNAKGGKVMIIKKAASGEVWVQ